MKVKINTNTLRLRRNRAAKANEMIEVIASCGRKFFKNSKGDLGHFDVTDNGRVWYVDQYRGNRIYMHRRSFDYYWRGFSGGGTLKRLVESLANYVKRGEPVNGYHFGPWHKSICGGDLWAYGEDMDTVREAAKRLGFYNIKEKVNK